MPSSPPQTVSPHKIWWTNGAFFVLVHIAAAVGIFWYPLTSTHWATLVLCVILFQSAEIAITVGYHRLYSHRAFRARSLRHRLHHRFTDDPVHDPYAATRGLLWAHMGWIFFKPRYERLELIDRDDLDNDPVVRFQHKYYVPLALFMGLILPPLIGTLWGDPVGAFVWGSLVARLLIWHSTFFVNSLAHWNGLQPYSDENTSKSNLLLALLTCGEGNHNFHAFPHDYRSGPSLFDWDPSKWLILLLHTVGLVSGLKRARPNDIHAATAYMAHKKEQASQGELSHSESECCVDVGSEGTNEWQGETWTWEQVGEYVLAGKNKGRCVIVINGYAVDATEYLGEHPGGSALLRKYSVRANSCGDPHDDAVSPAAQEALWRKADWAFDGGMNNHSHVAKRRMRELRVAKLSEAEKN
ncbi:hypothetical protein AcW1_001054 [Taiwanofungus camphoratus]|nr:hypothetical protein AcW2_000438 [Antrodia cinnamomea]KAI0936950.1 hypothetical protein AcV5_004966 [Antrodia cinnamomea]KAI0962173.1 hypothetical protein AcV7_001073 [Antrodia cinnamomea]KAI0964175.1 hypothetical protein AcW1_001054 [Antrodia cinnamomea]